MNKISDDRLAQLIGRFQVDQGHSPNHDDLLSAMQELALYRIHKLVFSNGNFAIGDHVEKTGKAKWSGEIVGFYSTRLTPVGYAIESEFHENSVQIYPETVLQKVTRK